MNKARIMLTLFAVPKPFDGHVGVIQRNALRSWRWADPRMRILLLGNAAGIGEAAREIEAEQAEVDCNAFGTPLLDAAFRAAIDRGQGGPLAFVNADIILSPRFIRAVRAVDARSFLLCGQSRDAIVEYPIDFSGAHVDDVLARFWRTGTPRGPFAMDYFAFSTELARDTPPFAIGRARYDNWLLGRARRAGAMVVDAGDEIRAVHQHHDYAHLTGGFLESRRGAEARENERIAGWRPWSYLHSTRDCTHVLADDILRGRRRVHIIGWVDQLLRRLFYRLRGR